MLVTPSSTDAGIPSPVFIANQLKPSGLRRDATHLVWLVDDSTTGAIMKHPLEGGVSTTIADHLVQPDALTIDEAFAYWLGYGSHPGVFRAPLTGGATEQLVSASPPMPLRGLAVDGSHLYYLDAPASRLMRIAKSGGAPEVVATGLTGPVSVVVDGDSAYVAEAGEEGAIVRVLLSTGQKLAVATNQPEPRFVLSSATELFWINGGVFDPRTQTVQGAGVMRVSKTGGGPQALSTSGDARALHLDGEWLYWTSSTALLRARLSTGSVETLVSDQPLPSSVVSTSDKLFWSSWGTPAQGYADGDIRRSEL